MIREVYICAPFGAPTLDEIRANVAFAAKVGAYAERCGYTAVVPHVKGLRVVEAAGSETPGARAAAMASCLADVERIARAGGHLWVVAREDWALSDGCAAEVERWRASGGRTLRIRSRWWWEGALEGAGVWPA